MPRSFDRLARRYAALEHLLFGSALQRMRGALAEACVVRGSVLVLGEGDGRFAETLLRRNHEVRLTIVDGSERMLQRARERTQHWQDRVTLVHAEVVGWLRQLPDDVRYDAVVTAFFLDCLTESEVTALFDCVTGRVSERWLWADFVVPERGPRQWLARWLLGGLYLAFRATTNITARRLTDCRPHFRRHDWQPGPVTRGLGGLLEACTWSPGGVVRANLRS